MKRKRNILVIAVLIFTLVFSVTAYAAEETTAEETTTATEETTTSSEETTTASDETTEASDETTDGDSSDDRQEEGGSSGSSSVVGSTNSNTNEIYSVDDLMEIKNDPSGSYKLMVDLDLSGIEWTPVAFSGNFDGNDHALLNVSIKKLQEGTRQSYDGNYVAYDTSFCGFFGFLENATVSNLNILGIDIDVKSDREVFAGTIAGYMDNGKIENCRVEGQVSVYANTDCFGIGGFAGFGNGSIRNSSNDVTLICVDENTETKDEQYMGGAYASGYIDLDKNDITIRGYDSDHGYVHNGGLVGMYILYPQDDGYRGYITNNHVSGQITFFEDNDDRRAYCEPFCGEIMNWTFDYDGNSDDFTADERFEYDQVLLPQMCEAPEYDETTVNSDCDVYGYTEHKCKTCDYSYKSDYKPREHQVATWTVTTEATEDEEGLRQGTCTRCNNLVFEQIPRLSAGTAEDETEVQEPSSGGKGGSAVVVIIIIVVVLAAAFAAYYLYNKRKQEELRRRKRAQTRRASSSGNVHQASVRNQVQRQPSQSRNRRKAPQKNAAQRRSGQASGQRRTSGNASGGSGRSSGVRSRSQNMQSQSYSRNTGTGQVQGGSGRGMRSRLNEQDQYRR